VSAARIALGLPFLVFVAAEGASAAAATGWILLGFSDYVDGWLARKEGTTRSGAFLDPLADKVITVGGFVALGIQGVFAWLPVAVIAIREVFVSVHRAVLGRRGVSVPARQLGKIKTFLQLLAVGFALLPPTAGAGWLVQGFLWLAVGVTLVSGFDVVTRGAMAQEAAREV